MIWSVHYVVHYTKVIQQQGEHVHLLPTNQVDREDYRGFLCGSLVKNLTTMQETWVQSLGQEDPLEKGIATHSFILVWRIPWTEDPYGLQSVGSQKVGHNWDD